MRKIVMFVLSLVLFITNVKAASKCSYAEQVELNELVGKIKTSYEIETVKGVSLEGDEVDAEVIEVSILNVTDKFYVVVTNNKNEDKKTFRDTDAKNGVIKFTRENLEEVLEYKFEIYSTDKTGCRDELIDTKYLTTPRFNPFHSYAFCNEKDDYELCQKYVTLDNISENDFIERIESYKDNEPKANEETPKEETNSNKIMEFLKEYKWYIAGVIGVVLIAIILISVKGSKKRKELGL